MTMKMIATSSSAILIVSYTKKCSGAGQPGVRVHPEPVVQQRVPQPAVHPVHRDPGRGRGGQGEDLTAVGGGDPFGDAHHGTGAAVYGSGQGGVQSVQRVRGQGVVDPPAAAAGGDQAGLAQHLQVVAEQVRGDRNVLLQVAHTRPAACQLAQQRPPDRVRSGVEQLCGSAWRVQTSGLTVQAQLK